MQVDLSKRDAETANIFPYFFLPSLEAFEELRKENKFNKPNLDTNRDEALIIYKHKEQKELTIQFSFPNYIEISIGITGAPMSNNFTLRKAFDSINKDNVNDLKNALNEYFLSIHNQISHEISNL